MTWKHKNLAKGQWQQFSLVVQLANVGSEVGRAILWRKKHDKDLSQSAFFRALELIDLTKKDPKNKARLKEICRMREVLVDYFFGQNIYCSNDNLWLNYFFHFNYAAFLERKSLTESKDSKIMGK